MQLTRGYRNLHRTRTVPGNVNINKTSKMLPLWALAYLKSSPIYNRCMKIVMLFDSDATHANKLHTHPLYPQKENNTLTLMWLLP